MTDTRHTGMLPFTVSMLVGIRSDLLAARAQNALGYFVNEQKLEQILRDVEALLYTWNREQPDHQIAGLTHRSDEQKSL